MHRRQAFVLVACATVGGLTALPAKSQDSRTNVSDDHTAWVAEVLQRILTVKPGMTREALLQVFTTEGGISTALQRTYASQDCPYFKVDVEFRAVGRPERDEDGRVTMIEDPQDVIVKISKPYLGFSVKD